jgi:phage terminase large subunit GpA-like protein
VIEPSVSPVPDPSPQSEAAEAHWSESEQRAWSWPDRLTPSQWSAVHRVLAPGTSPEPGPFNNDRTPYLAGIMDAAVEEGIEEITVVKATQIGVSLALHNVIGFCIDQDPGPALLVLPVEQACKEVFAEKIKPLLESSPALKRHMSSRKWDTKTHTIVLDSMTLFGGWAGSPSTLAARQIRYVFL